MKFLAGLNTTELRRLQPFLSYLLSEIEALKGVSSDVDLVYGVDADILPTANENKGGVLNKVARADHTHLFKFPTSVPTQLPPPDGASYFDTSGAINIYVGGSPTTKVVASALLSDIQPTGVQNEGSADRYALADHSHPTAILDEGNAQTPVVNEIRYNTNDKLVRWDGSSWVPLSVEEVSPSDNPPNPAGGNPSAGTSNDYSRADHRHSIVLEPDGSLTSPSDRQLGVWTALDGIGNLCLAVYHQNRTRWELPFARPLLSQTGGVPSGKGVHTSLVAELALRTQDYKQGVLYFRRNGSTTWEPIGTVLHPAGESLGIVGELMRSSAVITPSGLWFPKGRDNSGGVRALPFSIRTYNHSSKPTSDLPTDLEDAYGFFIQDRRLIELYPQKSDGISFPVMLTGYQICFPLVFPSSLAIGQNTVITTNLFGIPALGFQGSTSYTNIPSFITQGVFVPMGIRKVRFLLLLQNPSSNNHTFFVRLKLIGANNTSPATLADITSVPIPIAPSTAIHFVSDPVSLSIPDTYSDIGGFPMALQMYRLWDLESNNNNTLVVGIVGLIAVRE